MLENCDKIMHLRFSFDACTMLSFFRFMHLTHQNLSAHALFCHNSLAKVNKQLLIYNCYLLPYESSKEHEVVEHNDADRIRTLHIINGVFLYWCEFCPT